jgi:signal transduction histidine kinase
MNRTPEEGVMKESLHTLSKLLSVVIHDLRNPATALGINIPYIRDAVESLGNEALSAEDRQDLLDALDESGRSLSDLLRGLEQFGWVARWMAGEEVTSIADGDLVAELRELARAETRMKIELAAPEHAVKVRGAGALASAVDILIANAVQYAPAGSGARISVQSGPEGLLLEIRDQGPPVAADLRKTIFTAEGQLLAKKRPDGRYSRVVGLLAAACLAETAGAVLEADEDSGRALFRLRPKAAS